MKIETWRIDRVRNGTLKDVHIVFGKEYGYFKKFVKMFVGKSHQESYNFISNHIKTHRGPYLMERTTYDSKGHQRVFDF